MKYQLPSGEGEVLPNLLGLTTPQEIAEAEFEGFTEAEIILTEELEQTTRFNVAYIQRIHAIALVRLYAFAGKWRDVNLSKGGFTFAAARFLPETMRAFDRDVLGALIYSSDREPLIADIAKVHAELLFIHPFREGNGRTARVLANLMARRAGHAPPDWSLMGDDEFDAYVKAVQAAAGQDYAPMAQLIRALLPA